MNESKQSWKRKKKENELRLYLNSHNAPIKVGAICRYLDTCQGNRGTGVVTIATAQLSTSKTTTLPRNGTDTHTHSTQPTDIIDHSSQYRQFSNHIQRETFPFLCIPFQKRGNEDRFVSVANKKKRTKWPALNSHICIRRKRKTMIVFRVCLSIPRP